MTYKQYSALHRNRSELDSIQAVQTSTNADQLPLQTIHKTSTIMLLKNKATNGKIKRSRNNASISDDTQIGIL